MTPHKIMNDLNLAFLKFLTPFWPFLGTATLALLGYWVLAHGPCIWDCPPGTTERQTSYIPLCLSAQDFTN